MPHVHTRGVQIVTPSATYLASYRAAVARGWPQSHSGERDVAGRELTFNTAA